MRNPYMWIGMTAKEARRQGLLLHPDIPDAAELRSAVNENVKVKSVSRNRIDVMFPVEFAWHWTTLNAVIDTTGLGEADGY